MPPADVTKLIEEAIRDNRVLRVTYRAEDGTVAAHVVEPLAIRFNRAEHCVLWDGIEDAVATGETFAPRRWIEPDEES